MWRATDSFDNSPREGRVQQMGKLHVNGVEYELTGAFDVYARLVFDAASTGAIVGAAVGAVLAGVLAAGSPALIAVAAVQMLLTRARS